MGSDCLMGTGFILGDGNVFELDRGGGYNNIVNILNATQLFILKWLILYCVNFRVIFEKKSVSFSLVDTLVLAIDTFCIRSGKPSDFR